MADNIDITPGSGKTVRTDDVSGVQTQVIKIALGGDGVEDCLVDSGQQTMANSVPVVLASNHSDVKVTLDSEAVVLGAGTAEIGKLAAGSAAIGKLAANSGVDIGDVDVTSISAGENHLGAVGGNSTQIDVTVAAAAAAYSSGDMVGAELTIADIARINGGTGKITGVTVIDYGAQSVAAEIWITDTAITEPADNAAWSISDADAAKVVTVIPITSYYASALNSVSPNGNLSIPFKCTGAVNDLYMCFVSRGAPTYIANGIIIRFFVDQD